MTPLTLRLRIRSVQVPIYGISAGIANVETDVESIVQALRTLEDDHPFDAQKTRPELLDLVLAALSRVEGAGMDPHSLVRAALCQEITRREDAEREIATLRRERDEARAVPEFHAGIMEELFIEEGPCSAHTPKQGFEMGAKAVSAWYLRNLTTPTTGAQA